MANYPSFISRVNIGSKQLTQKRKWQSRQRHPQCRHRELPDASGLLLRFWQASLINFSPLFPDFHVRAAPIKRLLKERLIQTR